MAAAAGASMVKNGCFAAPAESELHNHLSPVLTGTTGAKNPDR